MSPPGAGTEQHAGTAGASHGLDKKTDLDKERNKTVGIFQSLEDAKAYFQGERFATGNGMTLEALTEESAACEMEIQDRHRNALDGVMGGAIFTLADFASAALTNHLHSPTVAQQVSINFLSLVKGTRLRAVAKLVKNGRQSLITEVEVTDDLDREIARMTVTSFKLCPRREES